LENTVWNRQSVPKRRHIKFRRRGITQKKAYNIQNMVESLKSRNLGWTLQDTANTVKRSWWWAKTSPETCRADLE